MCSKPLLKYWNLNPNDEWRTFLIKSWSFTPIRKGGPCKLLPIIYSQVSVKPNSLDPRTITVGHLSPVSTTIRKILCVYIGSSFLIYQVLKLSRRRLFVRSETIKYLKTLDFLIYWSSTTFKTKDTITYVLSHVVKWTVSKTFKVIEKNWRLHERLTNETKVYENLCMRNTFLRRLTVLLYLSLLLLERKYRNV